jgi:hypothetical protein
MRKLLYLVYLCSMYILIYAATVSNNIVGSWYPVFFTFYQPVKVQRIIDNINQHHVSAIVVSYVDNQTLALEISNIIKTRTHFTDMTLQHIAPNQRVFDRNRVVVTVYSSHS